MTVGLRQRLIGVSMARKNEDDRKWLSVNQAADYLGFSKETIYRRLHDGSIPSHRIGKLHRFDRDELDKWVKKKNKK